MWWVVVHRSVVVCRRLAEARADLKRSVLSEWTVLLSKVVPGNKKCIVQWHCEASIVVSDIVFHWVSGHKVCWSAGSDPAILFRGLGWVGQECICWHCWHQSLDHLENEWDAVACAVPGEFGGDASERDLLLSQVFWTYSPWQLCSAVFVPFCQCPAWGKGPSYGSGTPGADGQMLGKHFICTLWGSAWASDEKNPSVQIGFFAMVLMWCWVLFLLPLGH